MSDTPKFYLTTPIYYVNARPHIGHAYTTIVADVIARRHRLLGDDTFFLTGTDEHGQKIERSAAAAGMPPQQFADQVSASFENLWKRMGITHDDFIRTTSDRHKAGVQKLFALLQSRGAIYLSSYTGQYCVSEEMFIDGPPGTIGPDGKPTETVTEENYFFRLSDYQLPLLNLIESGELAIQPEVRRNEVLSFLRGNTSATQPAPAIASPTRHIAANSPAAHTQPAVTEAHPSPEPVILSEAQSAQSKDLRYSALGTPYVPGALKDLSISRTSFKWGIPVPTPASNLTTKSSSRPEAQPERRDPRISSEPASNPSAPENPEGHAFTRATDSRAAGATALPKAALPNPATNTPDHIIYVWLDALANYMTAIGYGSDDPDEEAKFKKYWPADLHLVGKEIIRFHCVYWPAFLLAANLPLPKAITAHGWLLFQDSSNEATKMSKSKGNIVRTETILDAFGTLLPKPTPQVPNNLETNSADRDCPEPTGLVKGTASAVPQTPTEAAALAAEVRLSTSDATTSTDPWKHQQDLFASDVLRYFLLREIPFGQDGSFSFDALVQRYNADLANGYGNLVSRTLRLIQQNFSVGLPRPTEPWICLDRQAAWGDDQPSLSEGRSGTKYLIQEVLDFGQTQSANFLATNNFNVFLAELAIRIRYIDSYLSVHKPWLLAKATDEASRIKLTEVLYTAAESIRIITALLYPILPYATAQVWRQLGLGDIEQAAKNGELKDLQWGGLKPGTKLGPLAPIFPRADKSLIETMTAMEESNAQRPAPSKFVDENFASQAPLESAPTDPHAGPRTASFNEPSPGLHVAASTAITTERTGTPSHTEAHPSGVFAHASQSAAQNPNTAAVQSSQAQSSQAQSSQPIAHSSNQNTSDAPPATDASPQITIDDFAKVELRVARILVAERIPKADKLLRLEVDLGTERRQILSGIAEWYTPEDLIGRKIIVITNLAPRKMRGLESHGMLLAASTGENGKPALATFADSDPIEPGARLK